MWSDAETDVDLLSVQHIVDAIERVVRDDNVSPVTIGVFGDWGSGKSSVVRMLRARLDSDPAFLCVYFNGWLFEGYEDARAALAGSILDEVRAVAERDEGRFDAALEKLDSLRKRVDWLRLGKGALNVGLAIATGGVSTLAGAATTALSQTQGASSDDLAKLLKARAAQHDELHISIRDFHQEFAQLLQIVDLRRVVVVVDDLDRCLPERVIETLEAIRLFLSVDRTAFVIAADQSLIRHAISVRYPNIVDKESVGRDYMERMIQVPIEVPPLTRSDLEAYVHLLFAEHRLGKDEFKELCKTLSTRPFSLDPTIFNSVNATALLGAPPSADLAEDLALATQVADVLTLSVRGNPRQTKRFLNALMIRLEMLKQRGVTHQRAVAAKLLLLEYFNPEVFRGLAEAAIKQGGTPHEIKHAENEAKGAIDLGLDTTAASETAPPFARSREGTPELLSHKLKDRAKASPPKDETPSGGDELERVEELPLYLASFRSEPWLRTWLASDPPIADVDIRPYIHFARERLGHIAATAATISPEARESLRLLMSNAVSGHRAGAERARTLTQADLSGIVRELATRARRNENISREGSELHALFELADKRPEIANELISLLGTLSIALIEPSVVSKIATLVRTQGVERPALIEGARALLTKWSTQSTNSPLATGAGLALPRLTARTPGAASRTR